MELECINVSVCAAALHAFKDPSMDGRYPRIMVYFLLSCFCDWICKLGAEWHLRGQHVELRKRNTNQDSSVFLKCDTKESHTTIRLNQCGLSKKRGCKTSAKGITVCLETRKGTKNSQGLGYNISTGALCHCGFDFRLRKCTSNGGANLNAADTRAERTGLNLHFILIILFSTNKLTPEKT